MLLFKAAFYAGKFHHESKELPRQEYNKELELFDHQLEKSFEQKELQIVCDLEHMLLLAANGGHNSIPESVVNTYSKDIDL